MKVLLPFFSIFFIFYSVQAQHTVLVKNEADLNHALEVAGPGSNILLANGSWEDLQIVFKGVGTENAPITLGAETPGKVKLVGRSNLKLGGEYLVVRDLIFTEGHTPSQAVIEFKIDSKNIANHCRVSNIVIEDYNQPNRSISDLWVVFWGRNNQLDHSYLGGKFNEGPTLRVSLTGNKNIKTNHQITNNLFGPRPRKGGPKAETIQIGSSDTSMAPGWVNVANNFFEECNGEVEVISNKGSYNSFRNNVFYKSEGSLVIRHGNYCTIDGNMFIGDGVSPFYGGIRIINTGHLVTNNYFYNLRGEEFRGPLSIMNGIPKSPQNRYNQVTDVVVAFNTWIDSPTPWHIGVGANIDKIKVLPPSEIRSARPERVIIANNLIYNSKIEAPLIRAYDTINGVEFRNNIVNNKVRINNRRGILSHDFHLNRVSDHLFLPSESPQFLSEIFHGFEFEKIDKDIFGESRKEVNMVGSFSRSQYEEEKRVDRNQYGPKWFEKEPVEPQNKIIIVKAEKDDNLTSKIERAQNGDTIMLEGNFMVRSPLKINKKISFISDAKKATLEYQVGAGRPLFELEGEAELYLENLKIKGAGMETAFGTRRDSMYNSYSLEMNNVEVKNFKTIFQAYKGSFANSIILNSSKFSNSTQGFLLNAEKDDRGDYSAEFVEIKNSDFQNIKKDVLDYYRGGYDESTIGGNLLVSGSRFTGNGSEEESGILLKTRGIVNVEISNNSFENNQVKLIALLWGEKGNTHKENTVENSGKFVTEEFLKLKLVY